MNAATPAQQEAFDACLVLARVLQAGLPPTPKQLQRVTDAIAQLKTEPQPPGFVDMLEAGIRAFVPEWQSPLSDG